MGLNHFILTVFLGSLSLARAANSQSAYGALSFSPPDPTTNDTITVVFTPGDGQPDWCSFFSSVNGNQVGIIAFPFDCSPGNGTQNAAVIGKLLAGTYHVIWTFTDNFDNVPVPTGTLTVAHAPAQIPGLSVLGLLSLGCCVAFLGLRGLERRANAR